MSSNRKTLTKKVRFGVFKRDGFACQYCGSSPPSVVLEVDHINPVSLGGANDTDNLITSCFDCNRGKGAEKLDVIPDSLAKMAEVIKEKAAQLKAYEKVLSSRKAAITKKVNKIEAIFDDYHGSTFTDKFKRSVRVFVEKLPITEVEEAINIACENVDEPEDVTRYFCGICWNKINGTSK
jgi:hypothetical protein